MDGTPEKPVTCSVTIWFKTDAGKANLLLITTVPPTANVGIEQRLTHDIEKGEHDHLDIILS